MEYHNAIKHLVFIVTISFCSVTSAPLTTSLPSQASTPTQEEKLCRATVSSMLKTSNLSSDSILLPRCNQQGKYKALQFNLKDIYSQKDQKKLQCVTTELGWVIDARSNYNESKPCTALEKCVNGSSVSDHKLISCDKLGYFNLIQKTDTGKICVNSYGIITKTSNVTGSGDCPNISIEREFNKDQNTFIQAGNYHKTY